MLLVVVCGLSPLLLLLCCFCVTPSSAVLHFRIPISFMQIFLFGGITIWMSLLLNCAVSLVLCLLIVAQPLFRMLLL